MDSFARDKGYLRQANTPSHSSLEAAMSKEEKGMKFPPVSEEEREVVEKITPEAWDQILGHAQAYRITDQKMKDFAYILGDPVGGAHLGRKGNGVPEMRAILVDGSTKGELAQLNTDQVLNFSSTTSTEVRWSSSHWQTSCRKKKKKDSLEPRQRQIATVRRTYQCLFQVAVPALLFPT